MRIWSAWLQGVDQAPPLVRTCIRRWRSLHPSADLVVACEKDVPRLAPELVRPELTELPPALRADLLRLALLRDRGGIWVDATCFPMRPLSEWLPPGFFAFANPGTDRMLSNWLLASPDGGYIVSRWYDALAAYVTSTRFRNERWPALATVLSRLLDANQETARMWFLPAFRTWVRFRPYYAPHYIFAELYRSDPRFAQEWDHVRKVSADGPHALTTHGLSRAPSSALRHQIDHRIVPVYKLNRRVEPTPGSALRYLLDNAAVDA